MHLTSSIVTLNGNEHQASWFWLGTYYVDFDWELITLILIGNLLRWFWLGTYYVDFDWDLITLILIGILLRLFWLGTYYVDFDRELITLILIGNLLRWFWLGTYYVDFDWDLITFILIGNLLRVFSHYWIIIIQIVMYCCHILSMTHYYFCLSRYLIFLPYYLCPIHQLYNMCIISSHLFNYSVHN